VLLALLWLLQGIGAPACAMLLTRWFAASERGTYWGLWNISTNLGGFLSPIVVGESFCWFFVREQILCWRFRAQGAAAAAAR
jgi:sugar phosphate permease